MGAVPFSTGVNGRARYFPIALKIANPISDDGMDIMLTCQLPTLAPD